ncbi:TadE/TadG family type IV pilus assembly protein [Candidatus Leptofilum sp.]|uniref:TadE/TadG family type IV pilus assembly protein n=1 Tax=Candidatus Leptofilum sp. TaxID=3241576 RepID=UPI003B58DF2A
MTNFKQRFNDSPGQALVEFALIISVLLMMIFLIIESARILWAWNTVQNAAREGVRYAITGQEEAPTCAVDFGLPKFVSGDRDVCTDLRLASVIAKTHAHLAGLPLNEESTVFEDNEYYNIEVWGVDQNGQLQYDNAGQPNSPVVVRVTYRVPIITPFFTPILPSIPVVGQETLNNETFGQLGGSGNEGAALPPDLPPVPTPGVTPSPTPSPTPSDTPTPGPTETPTYTPTPPRCDLEFEGSAVAGNDFVFVTGDVGITVEIYNLSNNSEFLGSVVLGGPFDGHACDGFGTVTLSPALAAANIGDILLAVEQTVADNNDTTIVVGVPPTATPSPTLTPIPTSTPTNTPLPTATNTPSGAYIFISPDCGPGPDILFNVQGFNWPTNESVTLSWEGTPQIVLQANTHTGNFTYTWTFDGLTDGTYTVDAESGSGATSSATFSIPCAGQPTSTPAPTATLSPADLVAISPPTLISTPPIVAYQPVEFSVVITNTGDLDVENQFFVDIYLDPTTILTDRIPIAESDGYAAVSGLAGGASQTINILSQSGFTNDPTNHQVYGMVDSVLQTDELSETNNVTNPLTVNNVTPAATPTPTPELSGDNEISGVVQVLTTELLTQFRAFVILIDPGAAGNGIVATTQSDSEGFYIFSNIPPAISPSGYTVTACVVIDNAPFFGLRTGINPPNNLANVFMIPGPCS